MGVLAVGAVLDLEVLGTRHMQRHLRVFEPLFQTELDKRHTAHFAQTAVHHVGGVDSLGTDVTGLETLANRPPLIHRRKLSDDLGGQLDLGIVAIAVVYERHGIGPVRINHAQLLAPLLAQLFSLAMHGHRVRSIGAQHCRNGAHNVLRFAALERVDISAVRLVRVLTAPVGQLCR